MKILVLSFYYRPDLCAGSFRATAFVERLQSVAPRGTTIEVIATVPNRYHTFTADAPRDEERNGVRISRIVLPAHKSGMLDQSRSFAAFAREAARLTRGREYDLIFATSSRLMTAVLGAWLAKRADAELYLDIRDIFVDTISDVMPRRAGWLLEPVFSRLERWAVRRAETVNLVSRGFGEYFRSRYPEKRLTFFTNGIDDEFVAAANCPSLPSVSGGLPTVLYAGNLGEGQGMHIILPALARKLKSEARFRIIGDGGRRRLLEERLAAERVDNVELVPPMSREQLLEEYRRADVLFLHLNDLPAFEKVLPSKIFEYAALGKPIWAGVAGYSRQFIESEIGNAAVFHPCDVDDAVGAFGKLRMEPTPRPAFVARYTRQTISDEMARDLLSRVEADR